MKCSHPDKLVMGRETHGGRRFPIVWCSVCGAIRIDAGDRPGNVWHLPAREKQMSDDDAR